MEYRRLGHAGVKVSYVCLGCMTFGGAADEAESRRMVDFAVDQGINFFDTADVYTQGRSEEILGRALRGRRSRVIVATKVRGRTGDGPNDVGLSRVHIMQNVEESLRRLMTDYVDLYQVHSFDPETPLEETLSTLDMLVKQGKVRYIGCSNFAAWQLMKALGLSTLYGWSAFVSVQPRYNFLDRSIEKELIPLCQSEGIGVMAYSPLGGGLLTGKYRPGEPVPAGTRAADNPVFRSRWLGEDSLRAAQRFAGWAQRQGWDAGAVALAWVIGRPGVTTAIVGARSVQQLEAVLAGTRLSIGPEQWQELENEVGVPVA